MSWVSNITFNIYDITCDFAECGQIRLATEHFCCRVSGSHRDCDQPWWINVCSFSCSAPSRYLLRWHSAEGALILSFLDIISLITAVVCNRMTIGADCTGVGYFWVRHSVHPIRTRLFHSLSATSHYSIIMLRVDVREFLTDRVIKYRISCLTRRYKVMRRTHYRQSTLRGLIAYLFRCCGAGRVFGALSRIKETRLIGRKNGRS